MLVHKSPKLQMIDDPKVVITQYVVSAVVIVYFLFNIFQNFGYWKLETPYGSTNMWAEGYDASNDAGLCSRLADYDFVYSPTWTYENNKCRQFTYGEVMRKLEDGGFYIQTYVSDTVSTYTDCAEDGAGCRNVSSVSTNYFVPGVDDIEIFVEHGFTAVQRGVSKLMPKTTVWKKSGDWKDTKNKEEESFSEEKPFKMKLRDLLKLAGVDSIDAPNYAGAVADSEGTPAYRMTGMVIELQIDYTNKIPGYYEGSEYIACGNRSPRPRSAESSRVLHAIDATPARWRGDAGSSTPRSTEPGRRASSPPCTATRFDLISTQASTSRGRRSPRPRSAGPAWEAPRLRF